MSTTESAAGAARDETDISLRAERARSDLALAAKRTDLEAVADQVVEHARDKADAVLEGERDRADQMREPAGGVAGGASAALVQQRAREDEAVNEERAEADESLRRDRNEQARVLAALLPLERDRTDRDLLTERRRSDDALAQRDDFLGIVSHDLRNLLSGIVINASLVAEDAASQDEARREATAAGLLRIRRYAARMNRLVGDLVDVASIEAGRLAVHREQGDAAALLSDAVEAFAHAAADKGVALRVEKVEASLPGSFDAGRMLQVLANLITNALKFTPSGGVIVVRGAREGGGLHLAVHDSGAGIPEGIQEAVFERFWQASKTTSKGLGLGLYISRCIVEEHGGTISVESAPGKGSTFHVTIPDALLAAAPARGASSVSPG